MAEVVRDFEPELSSIVLRPFDDGRFVVRRDGAVVFDKDRTGRFPRYEQDVKPGLSAKA